MFMKGLEVIIIVNFNKFTKSLTYVCSVWCVHELKRQAMNLHPVSTVRAWNRPTPMSNQVPKGWGIGDGLLDSNIPRRAIQVFFIKTLCFLSRRQPKNPPWLLRKRKRNWTHSLVPLTLFSSSPSLPSLSRLSWGSNCLFGSPIYLFWGLIHRLCQFIALHQLCRARFHSQQLGFHHFHSRIRHFF